MQTGRGRENSISTVSGKNNKGQFSAANRHQKIQVWFLKISDLFISHKITHGHKSR